MIPNTLTPHTDSWYAARRDGITGTDLPKILGLSTYGNALSVWLDKRGELPPEPTGEAAQWGHLLEDTVCNEWARRQTNTADPVTVEPTGVIANHDNPWMRASPDRLVYGCPDTPGTPTRCYLEAKTRSAFTAGRWRHDIPDDVLAQVAWTTLVGDFDHAHVAALIGGNHLTTHRYDRDPALEAYLIREATTVWDHVQAGTRPHVDADPAGLLLSILNREAGARAGERDVDPDIAAQLLTNYAAAAAAAKTADGNKKAAQTDLIRLLGEGPGAAHTALINGHPAYTYKTPTPTWTLTTANLRRLAKTNLALYQALRDGDYLTQNTPAPRFAVKKTTEETP